MDLGLAGEMSGTTATVALVEQHANGNSLTVVLAWVGDSAAIRVDMEMKPEHALVESTPMHKRAAGRTSDRASTHDITATRTLLRSRAGGPGLRGGGSLSPDAGCLPDARGLTYTLSQAGERGRDRAAAGAVGGAGCARPTPLPPAAQLVLNAVHPV